MEVGHVYVRASEETKEIWKWSASPRTTRDQAAMTAAPQKIYQLQTQLFRRGDTH